MEKFKTLSQQRSTSAGISLNHKQRDYLKAITFVKLVTLYSFNVCGNMPLRVCVPHSPHSFTIFGLDLDELQTNSLHLL